MLENFFVQGSGRPTQVAINNKFECSERPLRFFKVQTLPRNGVSIMCALETQNFGFPNLLLFFLDTEFRPVNLFRILSPPLSLFVYKLCVKTHLKNFPVPKLGVNYRTLTLFASFFPPLFIFFSIFHSHVFSFFSPPFINFLLINFSAQVARLVFFVDCSCSFCWCRYTVFIYLLLRDLRVMYDVTRMLFLDAWSLYLAFTGKWVQLINIFPLQMGCSVESEVFFCSNSKVR